MARKDGKPGRIKQIRETYTQTAKSDPKIGLILAGVFFGLWIVVSLIGFLLTQSPVFGPLFGFMIALLSTVIVFGKRAERAAYAQIDGQPGAAAAVLKSLKAPWSVTPAVAATRNQDFVHRVVGRSGVILVSEGPSNRVRQMLTNEKKRTQRFVPDVQITELQSGNDEGQIPIRKLNRAITKQKKILKPPQVNEIRKRLEALANQPVSAPKGPMPKSVRAARIQRN
ncbi:MAG: DUF4191 domain-containing protein [Actinomycetes bacterium]